MKRVRFSDYYAQNINNLLFRWVDVSKIKIINDTLSSKGISSSIIDIGSGPGHIASKIKGEVCCVDYDDAALEICRKKSLKAIKANLDEPLPFKDHSVSAVLCVDAIEHVQSPDSLLKEMKRITKPGGVCIIFTPRYDSAKWVVAEKFHGLVTRQPTDHISPFTKESFERRLSKLFKDFKVGTTNFNMSLYAIINM